jgi:hypothetical protein
VWTPIQRYKNYENIRGIIMSDNTSIVLIIALSFLFYGFGLYMTGNKVPECKTAVGEINGYRNSPEE